MFLQKIAEFGIPVVDCHDPVSDPTSFMSQIRDIEGNEGVIIAWSDGHRVKAKGDWYILRHRAKDKILRENGVIEMILDEKLDDVKPVLADVDRIKLDQFETDFWSGIAVTADIWSRINRSVRIQYGDDRKSFAQAEGTKVLDGNLKSQIFRAWDVPVAEFDWKQSVIGVIAKNIGTQPRVDAIRILFGNAQWRYGVSNSGDAVE